MYEEFSYNNEKAQEESGYHGRGRSFVRKEDLTMGIWRCGMRPLSIFISNDAPVVMKVLKRHVDKNGFGYLFDCSLLLDTQIFQICDCHLWGGTGCLACSFVSSSIQTITLIVAVNWSYLFQMYNLIRPGDNVRSPTLRKVTTETQTGSKTSQRINITLTILVETISYDPTVCILHLKGSVDSV